jgi:2-polyprenyl-6-hydroxyphenyl methylase/3-demethylubiquinone-9 3-methyltransferase
MPPVPTLPDYLARYYPNGQPHTDLAYLHGHYPRFCETLSRYLAHHSPGGQVLDIGAHWLHQSLLWRRAGFSVTALDLHAAVATTPIAELAACHGVNLLGYSDLAAPSAFSALADNSADVVLFCEVLEHITFNPVAFWGEVYRVMKPGATLVVTTPNFYRLRGKAWRWLRFLGGHGSGASVGEILATPTHGTHWKEYSRREVREYFAMLSLDFAVTRADYARHNWGGPSRYPAGTQVIRAIEALLPPLRQGLHVEVTLVQKRYGLMPAPTW